MLLGACILGISGLIDLVMGRSEWHAGMERSARTHAHADTHMLHSLTHADIFRQTLERTSLSIYTLLKMHTGCRTPLFIL